MDFPGIRISDWTTMDVGWGEGNISDRTAEGHCSHMQHVSLLVATNAPIAQCSHKHRLQSSKKYRQQRMMKSGASRV